MKKLLIALLMISSPAWARIDVPIVLPFGLIPPTFTNVQAIIQEANASQTKYNFVVDHRPGAGGGIGARHVETSDRAAVLATTPSFFINQYLLKEKIYDENKFSLLNTYCADLPIALISKKFQTLRDLPKRTDLTVGINGGLPDLIFHNMKNQLDLQLVAVPFQQGAQTLQNLQGGHIDTGIVISLSAAKANNFNIVGITGKIARDGAATLESQGLKSVADIQTSFWFLVRKDLPESQKIELSQILNRAALSQRAAEACAIDHGRPINLVYPNTNAVMAEQSKFWKQKVDDYQRLSSPTK